MFEFFWQANPEGYEWLEATTQDERYNPHPRVQWFLVESHRTDGRQIEETRYAPLDCKDLYRTFAATVPIKEGILDFASKYGRLGGRVRKHIILNYFEVPKVPAHFSSGELFHLWQVEILKINQTIELWDKAQQINIEGLRETIWWDGTIVIYDSHPKITRDGIETIELLETTKTGGYHYCNLYTGEEDTPPFLHTRRVIPANLHDIEFDFRPDDLLHGALYCVQHIIEEHLGDFVLPRVVWDTEEERFRFRFSLKPQNLLDALWLQFAQANSLVQGEHRLCQAPECANILEAMRSNRKFCSSSCKQRAYRRRARCNSPLLS